MYWTIQQEGYYLWSAKIRDGDLQLSFSKSLNEIKKNYEIYDKKMLTVIQGLENQRHLLKDAKFKFEVWTNHKI